MIPKILHLYWGGGKLSFMQYLTVVTFKEHNPDWRIWLWYPTNPNLNPAPWRTCEQKEPYTGKDYLDKAIKLCEYKQFDFIAQGIKKDLTETAKSDYIRNYMLYEYGGVYADMDFLFIRPIDSLIEKDFDYLLSYAVLPSVSFFNNGFLAAKPGLKIVKDCVDDIHSVQRRNMDDDYQSLGNKVFYRLFVNDKTIQNIYPDVKIYNMPQDIVYPYLPMAEGIEERDIDEMFFGTKDITTDKTIGIHWFNGHPTGKKFQNNFDEYINNGSPISKLVKPYYDKEK